MLPADTIAAITTNLAALHLEPGTAGQILAAVLAPLLRSSDPDPPTSLRQSTERRRPRLRRATRSKPRRAARRKRKYARHDARDRALAALRANPEGTPTEIAKTAKVSRATVVNARAELAKEARKAARKQARQPRETPKPANPPEPRQRAARFLREQLGRGPRPVTDVEAAASKAHVDTTALEQARADLHVVTSRDNAGGVMAVQWSLPG